MICPDLYFIYFLTLYVIQTFLNVLLTTFQLTVNNVFHKIFRASPHDLFANLLLILEAVTGKPWRWHKLKTMFLTHFSSAWTGYICWSNWHFCSLRSSSQGQRLHYCCDMIGDSVCQGRLPLTTLLRILTHRIHRLLEEILRSTDKWLLGCTGSWANVPKLEEGVGDPWPL